MNPLPRFAGAAILLLAMAVLALEVALTRVFGVMTYHHFTYLIIGLALLGFGAAGTILTVGSRFAGSVIHPKVLADCAWLAALTIVCAFLAITRVNFDSIAAYEYREVSQLFGLFMLLILAVAPFLTAGLCIGYLVSKSGTQINRLYFFDLVGAGLGSLGAMLGINYLGATSTIFWTAVLAGLVSLLIGGFRWRYALTVLLAAGLGTLAIVHDSAMPVPYPPSKLGNYHGRDYRWHVVARVDVTNEESGYPSFGGSLSRTYDAKQPPMTYRGIWQDGAAFTGIVKLQGTTPKDLPILGSYMQGCPYVLHPDAKDALVIGPGGGVDVAIALHHGAKHVTGVDINPWTIDYVQNTYNDFAGGLYRRPDVEMICAEGRHYLTSTDRKFDVIQLSGVDTFTALSSGAYALTENYLYTCEAISDCLDHLSDGGVLSYSRWLFTPPRETLRLSVIARTALEARGIEHPDQHILILAAPAWEGRSPWADTLIRLKPFTSEEVTRIRDWAARMRFDLIYDPLLPYREGGYYDALEPTSKYGPAICAREFDRALRSDFEDFRRYVAEYAYDIRPSTDDMPFFFNYYRLRNLLHPLSATLGGDPVNRLPAGLIVLLAAIGQIVVVGGALILWPMRSQTAGLRGQPGAFRILVYFACIGLGFIAAEIMLLQKLMVFLGGPVYSMSVTLASLLVFCGIGSLLGKRLTGGSPRLGGAVMLLILGGLLYGTAFVVNDVLPRPELLGLSHPMRCVVGALMLLPLGLFMGMPFPTGIRVAEKLHPPFVPWAWCVNACATVLGSVAAILAAMFVGLTIVLYCGIALYGVAFVALLASPRADVPSAILAPEEATV